MKFFSAATAVIIVCIQYSSGKHFLVQTKDTGLLVYFFLFKYIVETYVKDNNSYLDYDEDPSAADYSYARPSTSAPSSYAARTSLIPKSKYGDYSYARPSTSAPSSYARPSTVAPRSKYGYDYDYSSYSRPSYSRSGI